MKYKNKLILFFYLLFAFFYIEIITRFVIDNHVIQIFSKGIMIEALFAIPFCFMLIIFSGLFGEKMNSIVMNILLGMITILYISQLLYHDVFSTFYNFYSVGNATAILEFKDGIINAITSNYLWIVILFIPVVLLSIYGNKFELFKKEDIHLSGILVGFIFISHTIGLITVNLQEKGKNSEYDLYYNSSSPVLSVEKLGLLTTMRLDLQRNLTGWSPTLAAPPVTIEEPKEEKEIVEEVKKPEPKKEEPKPEYNVMEIDFDALIENEKNETLKNMHTYFKNKKPTEKNEYTGKFKDYNLILLTAEGFSPYAVRKDLTPTLYKLVNEGYQFKDFYVPIWDVSTSDGEYTHLQGLIPKPGVWSFSKSSKNHLPFVMGNQMKKLGYTTNGYHNHTYTYYDRDKSHPNLGYNYKGIGNGLDVKRTWTASDLEMMEKTVDEYINEESFHAYYMTVSGHLEYNFGGQAMAAKNKGEVIHLNMSTQAKAYLATQLELEKALTYLINRLEEADVMDNTLIAMVSDHYPYGLEHKTMSEFLGHEVEKNFEMYESNLIIYAEDMEKTVIEEPVYSIDVLPTLSNLMGLEYDSRLLMGRDVFSDAKPFVVFRNGSFITEKGKYNAISGKFILNEGVEVSQEYIDNMIKKVDAKFYYSAKILDYDYFGKILKNSRKNSNSIN